MNEVFYSLYADAYDWLYHDKDYPGECDLIELIFQTYGNGDVQAVLDLGCGTGNHAIILAQRGYDVVGVDRSVEMLECARRKVAESHYERDVSFKQGDLCSVDLGRKFDATLMMFAVLGYQLENADVLASLRTARKHLRPGGVLIFDFWYGAAVLHQGPSQRVKVIPIPDGQILRMASGELDTSRHLCVVRYRLWKFAANRLEAERQEAHYVRYFFPLELELLLDWSGFKLLRLGAFDEIDRDPDETTWNALAVARAV